jgi:hypothetical protein
VHSGLTITTGVVFISDIERFFTIFSQRSRVTK